MINEDNYVGKSVGNYRILALIGSGGFGSVYRGQHSILEERIVAIKILHTYLSSQEERNRFLQEARLLEHIQHPHILQIVDAGIDNGIPYLVTEYANHGSLRDFLKCNAHPILSEEVSLSILSQAGEALAHAHQQHVVHRDLKPENILFNANNNALLADFGIATSLSTSSVKYSSVMGTPSYMAPEQFRGTLSKEGDQYALGCIAYELFTGHVPFTAPDFFTMGFKHLTDQPIAPMQLNPNLPHYIEQAILKAMAKQREDRHPDVRAFITALYGAENLPGSSETRISTFLAQTQKSTPKLVSAPSPITQVNMTDPDQRIRQPIHEESREETLPPSYQKAASSISPTQEFFFPTVPSAFTPDANRRVDNPYVQSVTSFPQQSVMPPYTYEERPWDQSGQELQPLFPISASGWNGGRPPSQQKRDAWRRKITVAVACTVAAMTVIASLLFVFLPNTFSSHTITKIVSTSPVTTSVPSTTATISTATVKLHSGQLSHPTAISASTPTSISTTTSKPASTPTPTPKPKPTSTPTPTPTKTLTVETFRVYFSSANSSGQNVSTQHSYSGTVSLSISGFGQASGTEYSDAFYIYTDTSGNYLSTPHTATCWVLYINGETADTSVGLPSYDSSHTYNLSMNLSQPGTINFGICDGQPTDNTGYLTVTVQQQ